jgi:hypothetical protein
LGLRTVWHLVHEIVWGIPGGRLAASLSMADGELGALSRGRDETSYHEDMLAISKSGSYTTHRRMFVGVSRTWWKRHAGVMHVVGRSGITIVWSTPLFV